MSRSLVYLVIMACLLTWSCTPSVPSRYIQPGRMEDLLYDFHISQTIAEENGDNEQERSYLKTLYFAAVLEKYGVTKDEFDSSLVYYYVRADRFSEIYKNVVERLSESALDLGSLEGEVNNFTNLGGANSDTIDVWKGQLSAMLMPYVSYNIYSFDQKTDTSFRQGDSFMFLIHTDFIYQSGMRSAEACLSVRYDNDSVVSRAVSLSSPGINQIRIPANDNHVAKQIRGYIFMMPEKETVPSLKLMFVRNMQLIKFRKKELPSLSVPKDSLIQLNKKK